MECEHIWFEEDDSIIAYRAFWFQDGTGYRPTRTEMWSGIFMGDRTCFIRAYDASAAFLPDILREEMEDGNCYGNKDLFANAKAILRTLPQNKDQTIRLNAREIKDRIGDKTIEEFARKLDDIIEKIILSDKVKMTITVENKEEKEAV